MIGTLIDQYRIVQKLGEGGMGTVYQAVDINLDRLVAVKLLNSDLAGRPELLERFRAEARVQATLNHPNVATLYAFVLWQGAPVMVMEFVEGETLLAMVARRGPLPSQIAIPLFKQALLGIGEAHRRGIVHRDIKPANLMMNRDGCLKVMDFGIAKALGVSSATRSHAQMGTSWYMAPEQVLNQPVDARTDIYALGVTLYELLSGRVPFDAGSDYEIRRAHVQSEPPPPTIYYPHIPEAAVAAVLKAMSKDPAARFASAAEFGSALDAPAPSRSRQADGIAGSGTAAPAPPENEAARQRVSSPQEVRAEQPYQPARLRLGFRARDRRAAASAAVLICVMGLGYFLLAGKAEQDQDRDQDQVVLERQRAEQRQQEEMNRERRQRLEAEQRRSAEELAARVKRESAEAESRLAPLPEPPIRQPDRPTLPAPGGPEARLSRAPSPLAGEWRGTVLCGRIIPIELSISGQEVGGVLAKIAYAVPADQSGIYLASGAYTPETGRLRLHFQAWERRPRNAQSSPPDLVGDVNTAYGTISGSVMAAGCSGFIVRRQ